MRWREGGIRPLYRGEDLWHWRQSVSQKQGGGGGGRIGWQPRFFKVIFTQLNLVTFFVFVFWGGKKI